MDRPAAVDRLGLDQNILDLAAISAGIHSEAAADRAGNAGEEFEPGDAGLGRGERDVEIERSRPGANRFALGGDFCEAAAKPDRHAGNAAVADQKVRADADHRDRNIGAAAP